ncbi:MAG: hypothetical protein U0T36_01085 [Saprospiraceae bacterium]
MRYIYLAIFYLLSWSIVNGQETTSHNEFYIFKNEIGINVTNILGNVLSLNPNNANSPYGMTYRKHLNNWTFRSAFNIGINNTSTDEFSSGSFLTRDLNTLTTDVRLGAEKHLVLTKKVLFSYGLDLLLGYANEKSIVQEFNFGGTIFENIQKTLGAGIGPMLRFEYKLSDRIFFSTECSLYGYYSKSTDQLYINGSLSEDPENTNLSLKLTLPQSLFINIAF